MNFQTNPILTPLKVLIVNPLTPAGQMTLVKILSGKVFGDTQLIDLILLVYSNEKPAAEILKLELIGCAFSCYNKINISSDLPSISDADVFCFISKFPDPNKIDFDNIETENQFDAFYLIAKVANNLSNKSCLPEKQSVEKTVYKKHKNPEIKPKKQIIMADGLATMDVLKSLSKDLPLDLFFCPSVIPDIAKTVLADYLKVYCDVINDVFVWAANDSVFHVEIEKPIIINDQIDDISKCSWDIISKDLQQSLEYDHIKFSPSWMKKEFIGKIVSVTSKNSYGCFLRSANISNALKLAWASRKDGNRKKKVYCNLGVISDGSVGTIKGYPYVLPLVFCGDSWTVNECFIESSHLRNEIKRINKAVKEHHLKLILYCKKILQQNVIQTVIPRVESSSDYSTASSSKMCVCDKE